jgi:hypothetical protein
VVVCYKSSNFLKYVTTSVAEPHHFYAAPDPGKNFDAAPAPAPTLLNSKAKFLKWTKVAPTKRCGSLRLRLRNTGYNFFILHFEFRSLLRSRSRRRKKPHHFGGTGSEAFTRCGSGSNLDVLHKWIIKNVTKCSSFFLLFPFIFVTILIIQKSREK